jgi:hypothetical protein
MQTGILARGLTFGAVALVGLSLHPALSLAQTQEDAAQRTWENREMLKAKHRFDIYQATHPMTDAEAYAMGARDFNAVLAKEQIAAIKRADKAKEAYGSALLGTPQAPVERLKELEEKARLADKAVQDGWTRLKAIRASQATEAAQKKVLNQMLTGH